MAASAWMGNAGLREASLAALERSRRPGDGDAAVKPSDERRVVRNLLRALEQAVDFFGTEFVIRVPVVEPEASRVRGLLERAADLLLLSLEGHDEDLAESRQALDNLVAFLGRKNASHRPG